MSGWSLPELFSEGCCKFLCCFLIVREVADTAERTVVGEPRDDVEVRVKDFLPGCVLIVHRNVDTVAARDFTERTRNLLCRLHHAPEDFRVAVEHVHEVRLRYDERVALVYRLNVEEGEGELILVDDVGGDFPCDYFIENIHRTPFCHMW